MCTVCLRSRILYLLIVCTRPVNYRRKYYVRDWTERSPVYTRDWTERSPVYTCKPVLIEGYKGWVVGGYTAIQGAT